MTQSRSGCKEYAITDAGQERGGSGVAAVPAAITPGRLVVVEVYLLRAHVGGQLSYRCVTGRLSASETPDQAALRIGRIAPGTAVAVHSTSWRHLGDGSIVLAYTIAPDPIPDATAFPILGFEAAHGPGADRPSPVHVEREQVAAHAARHLALVADTTPGVHRVLAADQELTRALGALSPAPAGQLATS